MDIKTYSQLDTFFSELGNLSFLEAKEWRDFIEFYSPEIISHISILTFISDNINKNSRLFINNLYQVK